VTGRLLDLLHAHSGIVCTTGAGGKKTTLYRLAAAHPGRIALTASVATEPVPPEYRDIEIVAEPGALAAKVANASARRIAYATPSNKPGRFGGVPLDLIESIHASAGFEVTYVKADGARMRLVKAPNDGEPQIPPGTATVIPVVSARVIGKPLTEKIAHRLDLVIAVTGATAGEILTPAHLARLLASPAGALRGIGDAAVVPVINMVDDEETLNAARQAARLALGLTRRFGRIVLARMTADDPVRDVVERD
jgi:probable selenium-dependent hydroxylase accessory protein YqeC